MAERKELPEPPSVIATLGQLDDVDRTVDSLKMEVSQSLIEFINLIHDAIFIKFLMRLQSQDFISANQIQQELAKLIPNDPMIKQFAAILPDEAAY